MAYPGEKEHTNYMEYVLSQQEQGKKAMTPEQWREQKKRARKEKKPKEDDSKNEPISSILRPGRKGIIRT